jgi:cytochrome c-type biogenesis protein
MDTRMQALRFCTTIILLIVALSAILPSALANCNSTSTTIDSPACARDPAPNALVDLTISSIATVFAAGLLAGFNPCILAILAFLASSMLAITGRRKDILEMVFAFSLGMFLVYLIFRVGLFSVLQETAASTIFRAVLAAILLFLGLMQLKDARRLHGGGTSLFSTDWTKKYVRGVVASRKKSSYFLLGALFSLARAPCVGGIYIAIIGMISIQGYASSGLIYLMVYNIGIALPVLIIGGIIALGMSPDQVDHFRSKHRIAIRLITGLTLIAMAPIVYGQII